MYSFLYQLIYLPSYQPICLRIYRLTGLRSHAPSYLPIWTHASFIISVQLLLYSLLSLPDLHFFPPP